MTRWLDEQEQQAWRAWLAAVQAVQSGLDEQMQADADMPHAYYEVLVRLSEAPDRTLRMSHLASATNATLPRLSHVVTRLERDGFVERSPAPDDRRATLAHLTEAGWAKVVASAPGHVERVRRLVFDALTPAQVAQLHEIAGAVVANLDPTARVYRLA